MNIFVSGGTGLVGSEIVDRLLREADGLKITVGRELPSEG